MTTRGRGRAETDARPTAASRPSWRGPSTVPSLDEQVALGSTSSPAGGCAGRLGRLVDHHLRDAAVGPLVGHDRVGAGGTGAPVMILTAVPGDIASSVGLPGADLADHGQVHRRSAVAPHDVGVVHHGVAVHRGVVEAGSAIGATTSSARQAEASSSGWSTAGSAASIAVEDPLEVLVDRDVRPGQPWPQPARCPAGTRWAAWLSSSTSPTTWTPWPEGPVAVDLERLAFAQRRRPSGKRLSKSPTSL
jgi:hypothetical protein